MSIANLKWAIVSDRMRELLPVTAQGPTAQWDWVVEGTIQVDPELWQESTVHARGPLFRHYNYSRSVTTGEYYILKEFAHLYPEEGS